MDEVTNETNEKKALDVKEAPRNHYVSSQSMLKTEKPLKEEGQRCMVIKSRHDNTNKLILGKIDLIILCCE